MSNLVTQNSNTSIFSTESMGQITRFAELMAGGVTMLPQHLQGKPADCMAVAIQAASWGMNPFVVAQKTHIVNGTLGYEAQLVNAVISSSKAIVGRFHYRTIGDWSKWKYQARKITKGGRNGNYTVDAHGGMNEAGLGVQCGAILAGDTEVTWDDILYIEHIDNRNSPLWKSRPLQQMKYLAVKYWGRITRLRSFWVFTLPTSWRASQSRHRKRKRTLHQNQKVLILMMCLTNLRALPLTMANILMQTQTRHKKASQRRSVSLILTMYLAIATPAKREASAMSFPT